MSIQTYRMYRYVYLKYISEVRAEAKPDELVKAVMRFLRAKPFLPGVVFR